MRTLGPGSVASFLKIILDVVFAALAAGLGLVAILIVAGAVITSDPTLLDASVIATLRAQRLFGPLALAGLFIGALYLAGVMVIVAQLRRIFATLITGDPFHPDNVGRLRLAAVTLAVLEGGRYLSGAFIVWFHVRSPSDVAFSPTAWFAVLVVFVLAEVFREGARLRQDAELTI